MINWSKGYVVFLIFILCFIYMTGQLSNPYVRHDEWEFITYLLPGMDNHGTPWDKTLWEGRWINYWWSLTARNFSVNANYLFFILGYSSLCWTIAFLFTEKVQYRLLIAVSAFFCSAYADLSLWPATMSASVWISAISLYLYNKYQNKFILLLLFISLVMSYAPLIAPCVIFVMLHNKKGIKELYKLGIIYYIGYVIGVIFIYLLNYKYHNFLGVKIADWRHPNPIHSIEDLYSNIIKTVYFWEKIVLEYKYLLILSLLLMIFFAKANRDKFLNLLFSLLFIVALESALSIYTGVDIPTRAIIWPWFFFVAVSICAFIYTNSKYIQLFGIFFSVILILIGMERWYGFYNYESKHARFENVLGSVLKTQSHRDVYLCGDIKKSVGFGGRGLKPLALALWKKDGIYLQQAKVDECSRLSNAIGLQVLDNKTFYRIE